MPVRARALALASVLSALFFLGALPGTGLEPVAAAAPKVAILVGPTAITDSHYYPWAKQLRSTAQAAGATVDLRFCPTPKPAKAATAGANIIVYFGAATGSPTRTRPPSPPRSGQRLGPARPIEDVEPGDLHGLGPAPLRVRTT